MPQPKTIKKKASESLGKVPDKVLDSGCRDEAPTPQVPKNISCCERKLKRCHPNELLSLQKMVDLKTGKDSEVLQKVLMHPKGVILWSKKTLSVFYKRCKNDITYLDATRSIVQKATKGSAPFYVYELVAEILQRVHLLYLWQHVTCEHTTDSVLYFLQAFQTEFTKMYGRKSAKRPVMIICDGSFVLLQAISWTFCRLNLEDLLQCYFEVITGQLSTEKVDIPILHRCLSHIMKNAKDLC